MQYSDDSKPVNIFEATANGARDGLMLALNIGAMLLAFVALIALVNGMIGWHRRLVRARGPEFPEDPRRLLAPLAFLLRRALERGAPRAA